MNPLFSNYFNSNQKDYSKSFIHKFINTKKFSNNIDTIYNNKPNKKPTIKKIKKYFTNNFINFMKAYIIMILIQTILSNINLERKLESKSSYILLKFIGLGPTNFLSPSYNGISPDYIYINDTLVEILTPKMINITSINDIIKLEWINNINSCQKMFYQIKNISEVDLSYFDSSLVTDTSYMFGSCSGITSINLNNFETSSVTNMAGMFSFCKGLLSIDFSYFNTSSVLKMNEFIRGCSKLTSINVSNFDTSKVNDMGTMFRENEELLFLDLSNFNTSNVVNMYGMFSFDGKLTSLILSNFDTKKVTNFGFFLEGCKKLTIIDISSFDTSSVQSFAGMFTGCSGLIELDISHFNTKKAKDFGRFFDGCTKITSLNVSNFDTSNAGVMSEMFKNCQSLTDLDITNFNTSNVKVMNGLFLNCYKLTSINLSKFDTSKVTNMKSMFENCYLLTSLNLSSFNTSLCSEFSNMFKQCQNLNYINFYNFHISNKTNFVDFISGTPNSLSLCFNINNKSRIYQEYKEQFIEACLYHEEITELTTYILETEYNNYFCKQSNDYISSTSEFEPESSGIKNISISSNLYDLYESYKYSSNVINSKGEITYISELSNYTGIYPWLYSNKINEPKMDTIQTYFVKYNYLSPIIIYNITNDTNIYNIIIEQIIQNFPMEKEKSIIVEGNNNNFIFELTTEEEQTNTLNGISENKYNLSIIELGECKNLLMEKYFPGKDINISFIILKYEKITNISSEKNIQYELYEPYNKTKLDLSICKQEMINIYIPVELSEETLNIIESLKDLGYEIFNIEDPFYNDICTKYTSIRGTDMNLEDRKKYIYEKIINEVNCQENCELSSYSIEQKNIKCTCKPIEYIDTENNEKFSTKKLYESFYDVLKYSNYKVIKCYKLVFNIINFKKNEGFIISLIFFILYICSLIVFIFKGISPLKQNVANNQFKLKEIKKEKTNTIDLNSDKILKNEEKIISSNHIKFPPKKKRSNKNILKTENNNNKKKVTPNKVKFNILNPFIFNDKISSKKQKIKSKSNSSKNIFIFKENSKNNKEIEDDNKENKENEFKNLDGFELNNLEYENAKELDNRTFFSMYWSTLRREHLFIFTFLIYKDYNLPYIKISRFIFLICTDMAMNALFFADESMNKLYISYGEYDFIQQIPQMIYSIIISNIIDIFLCYLSLTDKPFYKIKRLEKNKTFQIFEIIKCVKIKLIIFFIFTFIVFILFIYLISAFCAVYENTQRVYLEDSLFSFLLGIATQFVLYFFPSILRFISLKCKKRNLKCIYKLSEVIPIF